MGRHCHGRAYRNVGAVLYITCWSTWRSTSSTYPLTQMLDTKHVYQKRRDSRWACHVNLHKMRNRCAAPIIKGGRAIRFYVLVLYVILCCRVIVLYTHIGLHYYSNAHCYTCLYIEYRDGNKTHRSGGKSDAWLASRAAVSLGIGLRWAEDANPRIAQQDINSPALRRSMPSSVPAP